MSWISVNEKLPPLAPHYPGGPRKSRVLVVAKNLKDFSGKSLVTEGCLEETFVKRVLRWKDCRGRNIDITHWMPLPDPPGK